MIPKNKDYKPTLIDLMNCQTITKGVSVFTIPIQPMYDGILYYVDGENGIVYSADSEVLQNALKELGHTIKLK